MARTAESRNKLSAEERLISPEDWGAYGELVAECVLKDIPVTFSFDTGRRYQEGDSDVVIQGRQGFRLEIGYGRFKDGDDDRVYRDFRIMVNDGWRLLRIIVTQQHIQDIEI